MGCGEVRDLCFGVLFVDHGTYFIAFVCMVVYFGYGNGGSFCFKDTKERLPRDSLEEPSSAGVINKYKRSFFRSFLRKNFFRESAQKNLLPQLKITTA